jgi:hypothetical protein
MDIENISIKYENSIIDHLTGKEIGRPTEYINK